MIEWDNDLFFKPRWGFAWYPAYDKLGHFICYYFATHFTDMWVQSLNQDIPTTLSIKTLIVATWFSVGVGYEFIYDVAKGRKPSWKDMVANLMGGVLGVSI